MAEPPIAWDQGDRVDPATGEHYHDHLTASLDETVTVAMRVDEEGDYIVSFLVGIRGSVRSLPEIEDFIRRVSAMIADEPVA